MCETAARKSTGASAVASAEAAAYFLLPGEMLVADKPTRVKTILGSCVAITVRAPRLGVAAVAHCLLPCAGAQAASLPKTEALKYVDSTVEILLETFTRRGAVREELEVKVFGGSDNITSEEARGYGVGKSNVETARRMLAVRGIDPAACDTGGRRGRVLEFHTASGDVFIKRLPLPSHAGGVMPAAVEEAG